MLENLQAPLDVQKKDKLKKQSNICGMGKNDVGSFNF